MFNTKSDNPNYLAKIVKLGPIQKHPNADKLAVCVIDGCSVITGLDAKENDIYVFFPIECAINKDYLAFSDSFQDKELNKNKEKKGFFVKTGRVRAIKLRGMMSEGYIVPAADFHKWINTAYNIKLEDFEKNVGIQFDHISDVKICEKYTIPVKQGTPRNFNKKLKRESKIIDGQFRLSLDAAHLKKNIFKVNPSDFITISYKMHGANMTLARVLCKKKLSWKDKIAKFFGARVQTFHYDDLWASRKVVKNEYADKKHESFYDADIWGLMAEKYKHCLKDGISLYGEVVNQLPSGAWIQRNFDYSVPPKTCEFFVFRATYTNASGDVLELTTPQIERYCAKMGLKMVPIFYYGRAKDKYPELKTDDHWHENFLAALIVEYTEKRCFMCKSDVPEEGAIIALENEIVEPLKLKSLAFLEMETKELDEGLVNIEDEQTNIEDAV